MRNQVVQSTKQRISKSSTENSSHRCNSTFTCTQGGQNASAEVHRSKEIRNNVNKIRDRRKRFEEIAVEFNIRELDDWYKVSRTDVYQRNKFIQDNYGNLFNALKTIYPDHSWDKSRFSLLSSRSWNNLNTRFKEIAEEFGIKDLDDWYQVSRKDVYKKIPLINGNLFNTLKTIYPNHSWDKSRFKILPKRYWNDLNNQRRKLEEVAREFNIKELDDWYSVPRKQVYKKIPFIATQYGNLFKILKSVYPDHLWDKSRFKVLPHNYWNDVYNQKKRFEEIGKEFNVRDLDDWYKVSRAEVYKSIPFITTHYGNLFNALKCFYPDHTWDNARFKILPESYWNDLNNQRKKLEEIADEFNVKELDDWYKVSRGELYRRVPFIEEVYGNLFSALKTIYPSHPWSILKFERAVSGVWKSPDTKLFRQILSDQMKKYHIETYSDWLQIPSDDLRLFQRISKNVYSTASNMLHSLFPEMNWKVMHGSSKPEMTLQRMLATVVHTELHARINGYSVDIYVPQWSLAIEYQGGQHYKQINTGDFDAQQQRDESKQVALQKLGISLIKVPYWWNTTWEQLLSTLENKSKDLSTPRLLST